MLQIRTQLFVVKVHRSSNTEVVNLQFDVTRSLFLDLTKILAEKGVFDTLNNGFLGFILTSIREMITDIKLFHLVFFIDCFFQMKDGRIYGIF